MSLTYKDAGVDILKGDQFVQKIKNFIRPTYNKKVISGVGGFCALYEISQDKWLATGTDGVGTKVKLAQELNIHDSIGQDLVGMCVNDIICSGASPAFFLDYLACGKLDLSIHTEIVKGIAYACSISESALIGGETAEMPGVYAEGVYDLAGFSVGELNPIDHVSGLNVSVGDKLVGIMSSGFHSNGFGLVRKLVNDFDSFEFKKELLTPTRLYWPVVKEVLKDQRDNILGMAHITGGGFHNIPRINENFSYVINQLPTEKHRTMAMNEIINRSQLSEDDLYQTFNMGIGFVFCVRDENRLMQFLNSIKEESLLLGEVSPKLGQDQLLVFNHCETYNEL